MRIFRCPACRDPLVGKPHEGRLYRECHRGHGIFATEGLLFPFLKTRGKYKQLLYTKNLACPGCSAPLDHSPSLPFCRACSSYWLSAPEASAFKDLEKNRIEAEKIEALTAPTLFLPWLGGLSRAGNHAPSTTVLWLVFALMTTYFLQAHLPALGQYAVFYPGDPLRNFGINFFLSLISHGNTHHLCINLFFLAIVGTLVERRLGRPGTLQVFFLSAVAGNLAQMILGLPHPTLGASGGIAGLVAALSLLEPEAHFTFSARPFSKARLDLPFELVAFFWLLSELHGLLRPGDGINHWAHLTGAAVGFLCVWLGSVTTTTNEEKRTPGTSPTGANPARLPILR